MESANKLGIWMDHSEANLINLDAAQENQVIRSKFSFSIKEEALQKGEKRMHNKEQQLNEAYYKEIANEILKYDHVLLFGPTNAKAELHNFLNKDLHFENVKVDVESADKMTENEKAAYVKAHFSKKEK